MIAWILVPSPVLAIDLGKFAPLLYLAGALLLGAFAVVLAARWRKNSTALNLSASDELARYRLLYEQGAISKEEFEKLRGLLGGELRKSLGASPAPKPDVPPSESIQPKPDEPPPETGIRPS